MEHLGTTTVAVAKVVLSVCIGAFASWKIPSARHTMKDFGFLITNVFIPCLFLSHMIEAVALEVILKSLVLFVMSILAVLLGCMLAFVFSYFLFPTHHVFYTTQPDKVSILARRIDGMMKMVVVYKEKFLTPEQAVDTLHAPDPALLVNDGYRSALLILSVIQNTFVLPLSLASSIQSDATWIDLKTATAYIFFYNIVITVLFWSLGPLTIQGASSRKKNGLFMIDVIRQHKRLQRCVSIGAQTDLTGKTGRIGPDGQPITTSPSCSPTTRGPPGSIPTTATTPTGTSTDTTLPISAEVPYWFRRNRRLLVVHEGELNAHLPRVNRWRRLLERAKPLLNPPLIATFTGLIIGLIPPLKWAFLHGPLQVVQDATSLLGDGTVPASLFLLGANLASDHADLVDDTLDVQHAAEWVLEDDIDVDEEERADDALPALSNSFTQYSAAEVGDAVLAAVQAGGTTTTASGIKVTHATQPAVPAPEPPKKHPSVRDLFSLDGTPVRFVISAIAIRLLTVPIILFIMVHYAVMSGMVTTIAEPCHNLLLLVVLLEIVAPSAINNGVLFNMYHFMVKQSSKALFYQYLAAILTLVSWLTIIFNYTSGGRCRQLD